MQCAKLSSVTDITNEHRFKSRPLHFQSSSIYLPVNKLEKNKEHLENGLRTDGPATHGQSRMKPPAAQGTAAIWGVTDRWRIFSPVSPCLWFWAQINVKKQTKNSNKNLIPIIQQLPCSPTTLVYLTPIKMQRRKYYMSRLIFCQFLKLK